MPEPLEESTSYEVGYGKPPKEHQFQPGKSPNPGGRPKGASIQAAILRDLAKDPDEDGIGKGAREVAQALMDVAAGRRAPDEVDTKAALALLDRTDGPLEKKIEHSGGIPVRVVIKGIDSP